MSRKGECLDKAVTESFFGSLKPNRLTKKTTEQSMKQNKVCLNITGVLQLETMAFLSGQCQPPVEFERQYVSQQMRPLF